MLGLDTWVVGRVQVTQFVDPLGIVGVALVTPLTLIATQVVALKLGVATLAEHKIQVFGIV